ncbi:ATP-dependent DNA helicase [Edwardsiella piscicida]|nr:ATP-dependent DNA helicase [Edwardsiella piscicida]
MTLSSALKTQISQWYKALAQQIPDFVTRPQQRQMIAEVARALSGVDARHLVIEAPTGVGKTLSHLLPGIAISRAQQKPLVVSTANVALQDQIYTQDLPLLRRIIPDLTFTAAFGRGRYVCPRNLAALSEQPDGQGSLLLFIDDALQPGSEEERAQCRRLQGELESRRWDGLRDHLHDNLDEGLWAKMSTDRASCLNRSCSHFRDCPFFLARREIESADVVVANHALVMAALESESVLPPPKDLLLVLDEGAPSARCRPRCAGDGGRDHGPVCAGADRYDRTPYRTVSGAVSAQKSAALAEQRAPAGAHGGAASAADGFRSCRRRAAG